MRTKNNCGQKKREFQKENNEKMEKSRKRTKTRKIEEVNLFYRGYTLECKRRRRYLWILIGQNRTNIRINGRFRKKYPAKNPYRIRHILWTVQ